MEAAGAASVFRTKQGGMVRRLRCWEEGLAVLQKAQNCLLIYQSLLGRLDVAPP